MLYCHEWRPWLNCSAKTVYVLHQLRSNPGALCELFVSPLTAQTNHELLVVWYSTWLGTNPRSLIFREYD